ncbi:Sporulation related domain-containing protein [Treponema berlinense]|uniref:Sporulation related domain-containing protein n=1 Tax=Treponema berlinense TaxID=225004 RepID=A0A1T4P7D1_9SPIR|nr:SPOR domain-containing protein [Treponema berlinense]SJZ87453.1 Sporulation related domain-containing protein [Treponema berlinense]
MKKILSLVFAVFTVATIFAAARPSVDGRAVVCEEGEMPKGLFAKTIGYLPGDSVTVTNPANGTTVDVLVLGSIDSGEGVAILLSSEAAEKLLIKKDSNVQVKITRRTGSIDESVSGTAVLTEESEENVSEPEAEQNIAESEENQDSVEFEEAETPVEENKISESDSEISECETPVEDTETVEPENTEPVEENTGSKAESEVLEEKPEDIENENSEVFDADSFDEESEAPADEQKEDLSESVETEELSETEDTNTENSPEPSEEDNSEKIDAPAPEAQKEPDGEIVDEKKPENLETEEDSASPESFSEDVENAETETSDDITEDKEQSEHFESEALSKVDGTEIAEEYAPIVLTPSALNPPETENENIEEESRDEPLKEVFVPEQADGKVESVSVVEENAEISGFESFVTTDAELKKGMYYLQIATLSNEENVANLTEKYGKKYPLALIKQENKNAYRVLVGPLNADEFGMIKERFESYGFKDAFLRKIK